MHTTTPAASIASAAHTPALHAQAADSTLHLPPMLKHLRGLATRQARVFTFGQDSLPLVLMCLSGLEAAQLDLDASRQGIVSWRSEEAEREGRELGAASKYRGPYLRYMALQVARTIAVPVTQEVAGEVTAYHTALLAAQQASLTAGKIVMPPTPPSLEESAVRRLTPEEEAATLTFLMQLPPPVLEAMGERAMTMNSSHLAAVGKGWPATSALTS